MFNIFKNSIDFGNGKSITIETGYVARQCQGSVTVSYGKTTILATVCFENKDSKDVDFFPMSVNYIEKHYAAGKIPGGFMKKETKPSDREILISRLIDRSLRPMFKNNFYRNVNIMCNLLSYDGEHEPEIPAMIAASIALKFSGLPIKSSIGATRVGYVDGKVVINPSYKEIAKSELDLVVSGDQNSVVMVESTANLLDEEKMLEAIWEGQKQCAVISNAIDSFAKIINIKEISYEPMDYKNIIKIMESLNTDIKKAIKIKDKANRNDAIELINKKAVEITKSKMPDATDVQMKLAFGEILEKLVRQNILQNNERIDGRSMDEVRQLDTRVNVLPIVHGSALFTRGQTQVLGLVTIGNDMDEKSTESITDPLQKESFMLDYVFNGFSTGLPLPLKAPSRREIGHGRLAYRALNPVLPSKSDFPHTIRLVSEILECDGSTSMGTVCAGSMALMVAGVPTLGQVGGIAMGLIKEGEKYNILTDIMADEDHLGDMDFKVAGTTTGITALQMDLKIDGISKEIMKEALENAKVARIKIINKMNDAIDRPEVFQKGVSNARISHDGASSYKPSRNTGGHSGSYKSKYASSGDKPFSHTEHSHETKSHEPRSHESQDDRFEVGKFYQAKVLKISTSGIYVSCNGVKSLIEFNNIIGFDGDIQNLTKKIDEDTVIGVRCNEIEGRTPVFSTKLDTLRSFSGQKDSRYEKREHGGRDYNRGEYGRESRNNYHGGGKRYSSDRKYDDRYTNRDDRNSKPQKKRGFIARLLRLK